MLSKIREHVQRRKAHLARRLERAPVPALGPQRTPARKHIVHVASHADGDAAHTARKRTFIARFHDEMDVIALYGEVDDTEAVWRAPGGTHQCEPHDRKQELTAKRSQTSAQRHVHGLALAVHRACTVRRARTPSGLSPCAHALAAPSVRERETELPAPTASTRARHLD